VRAQNGRITGGDGEMIRAPLRARGLGILFLLAALGAVPMAWVGHVLAAPSAQAYVEQAIALYNRGECVKAVGLLKRAVAANPRYVSAHSWLGFCYAKLGRAREAVAAFSRVVSLAPKSEDARVARAWIARLQPATAARPTPTSTPARAAPTPGLVYLVVMPAAAGVTENNRPPNVQLFGVTYRRALVERRNWWKGRRDGEREWRVVFNLQRRFSRFRALAGVEDGTPGEFTAAFEVRADGNVLFSGKPKRVGDVPDNLDLDVSGALQLELIVRGYDALHTRDLSVIWADPSLDPRTVVAAPSPALSPSPSAPASPAGSPPAAPPPPPAAPSPPSSPAPSVTPTPSSARLPADA
jgi:hypothetical protein